MEFPKREFGVDRGFIAFPDDRGLLASGFKMSVNAVIGDIQGCTLKPIDLARVVIPPTHGLPGREPVHERFCLVGPETIGIGNRAPVHFFIPVPVYMGFGRKFCVDVIDSMVAHLKLLFAPQSP